MEYSLYIIDDQTLIEYIEDNDLDGFKYYLESEDYLYINDPERFESEEEARAFCRGLGYGADERAPIDRYPLRSFDSYNRPFYDIIENYF